MCIYYPMLPIGLLILFIDYVSISLDFDAIFLYEFNDCVSTENIFPNSVYSTAALSLLLNF